ncbi:MAG: methylmalonyl-CoA epimerase [Bacillota bacterium]|nr:MAG: methylmalonyl-CoA epimerase [Bacillota bacterium]
MVRIDHVGIAVRDIDRALVFFTEVLGLEDGVRETVESQGLTIAFIPAGEGRLELLQPGGPDTPVGRFLETKGEGVHHIAFAVQSVEETLARAKAAGYALIDEKPRPGAGGARIAFVHPKSTSGVLVEFCEHDHDD